MGIEPIILVSQTNVLPLYYNHRNINILGDSGNRTHTVQDLGLANRYSTIERYPHNIKIF